MKASSDSLPKATISASDLLFDRYLGALLGSAIADALGWITEFRRSREELAKAGLGRVEDFVTWPKPTGGRFHTYYDYVSKGEYSDDTQLSLCTARSLRADGTFDSEHFVEELKAWLDYARGAGAAITAAARNLRDHDSTRWNNNFYRSGGRGGRRGYVDAGGNGAAMRIAPHALANWEDPSRTFAGAWENALTTHGHPRALIGAVTIAEALRSLAAVTEVTLAEFTTHLQDFVSTISAPNDGELRAWKEEWEANARTSFDVSLEQTKREMSSMLRLCGDVKLPFRKLLQMLGCLNPATKGSGTSCVAAAIGAYARWPRDYETAVLEIVNTPGIDTDTIASMYGSLVGVRVGSTQIPDRWATAMQDYEYLISVAGALSKIALRESTQNELRIDMSMIRQREGANVLELTRARKVNKNQRVVHYLLGPGWVQAVNEQRIRSGGLMLLADVVFDSGQTVRFKSFQSAQQTQRASAPITHDDEKQDLQSSLF